MVQSTIRPPVIRGVMVPMSWEEFLDWAPDEGQAEWVDGWGIAYVSTNMLHGRRLDFFATLLGLYVRLFGLGQVYTSSALMRLPTRPAGRMPDIMVIRTEHLDRVRERWYEGAADFVTEFLSEDDPNRDLVEKRNEFERAGLPEYVMVDARPGGRDFHFLRRDESGRFQSVAPDDQGRYHSVVIPGFWIEPSWFWQEPLPDPLRLLKRMAPERLRQVLIEDDESER
jgi:Uma2 family endonuclease